MRYRWSWIVTLVAMMVGSSMLAGWVGAPANTFAQSGQGTSEGAQPGEIVVGGQRFTFDRAVPIDLSQLEQQTDDAGATVYVKPDGGLLNAVYVPLPEDSGNAARYLPEYLDAPHTACPSETIDATTIQGPGGIYVPAGLEPDLTPEQLVEVGSTDDGRMIYAPSPDQPFNELFASGVEGALVHYVLLPDQGPPPTFAQQITFAGQQFQIAPGEEANVTPDQLSKIGCAGEFPALTSSDHTEAPFDAIYVQIGDRLVAYAASDAPAPPAATGTPAIPATPEATATSEAPTETLVPIGPIETQVPAGTMVPTETPTSTSTTVPTETPAPTSTSVPSETPAATSTTTPTAPPTETPPATSTSEPTETPQPTGTTAPTDTAIPTGTPAPSVTDTPQPTNPPATSTGAPQATGTTAPSTQAPTTRPTPTAQQRQPQAVAPTLPPEAPPPAVATTAVTRCSGNPGPIGDDGLPDNLPTSIQYGGSGYEFTGTVSAEEAGELTILGCVGPFEAFRGEQGDSDSVLYLMLANSPETVYRYEATTSFNVEFEVANDPRVLTLPGAEGQPDIQYIAGDPWMRSVYSSVSLILYTASPDTETPERIFARAVDADVIGEYVPEGSGDLASEDVLAAAEDAGILPELTLGGEGPRYVLVSLWNPIGTTTNGWLTLYGPEGEDMPEQLVGIDPRRLDLLVFDRAG